MNAPAGVPELSRRLYPHSWIFLLLRIIPNLIPAVLAAGYIGKNAGQFVGIAVMAAILLVSIGVEVFVSRRTHWDIGNQAVYFRKGIIDKETKIIPFNRIQNVKLTQNPFHRLLGVARVELESAGAKKPEATFNVLKLEQAQELSDLVQSRGRVAAPVAEGEVTPVPQEGTVLMKLSLGELIRFGIASNRGMIVLAAAFGAATQFMDDLWDSVFSRMMKYFDFSGQVDRISHLSTPALLAFGVSVILLILVFVRVLSIALAFWSHWNYTLTEQPRRLQSERGLVTRWHDAIVKSRIQSWRIREGIWHRLVKRQTVDVDTLSGSGAAVGDDGMPKAQSNHLLPVATPQRAAEIIQHLAPALKIDGREWNLVSMRNYLRLVGLWLLTIVPALIGTQIIARVVPASTDFINQPVYFVFLGIYLVLALINPWHQLRFHAYSLDGNSFGVRKGWLSRKWHLAEIRRAQAVSVEQGPLDRWFKTATLTMDTPGAARGVLKMPLLPYATAVALRDAITGELDRSISS